MAFDISRPFAQTPDIQFKLTFSITETNIPPSAYLVVYLQTIDYFQDSYTGTLSQCILTDYEETSGAFFDPLTDLNAQNVAKMNYISECTAHYQFPGFFFKLNQTLTASNLYQLSYTMSGQFANDFFSFVSLIFISGQDYFASYTYAVNLIYYIYGIFKPPEIYNNISLSSQRCYFNNDFCQTINEVLKNSLLSYAQASITTITDISIKSFNDMLTNKDVLQWDLKDYPVNIINYPGFLGNIMLEIYIDKDLIEFTAFELNVANGWFLEDSNCISVDFNMGNQKIIAIPHTRCIMQNDNQTLVFYNILGIQANSYLRFNITNIRNPYVPMIGISKLSIFNEKTKQFVYQNKLLSGLEVKPQIITAISLNSFDHSFSNKSSFFLNKTQRYMINMSIPYYDLVGESQIVIYKNNSNFTNYGFIEGSCQVIDKENSMIHSENKSIECFVNKVDNTLVIKNINKITADKNFYIYFMNNNEEIQEFINFEIEIFVINQTSQAFSTNSSYYYNETIELINETITILSAYYELADNSTVFDKAYEISSMNKPFFNIGFKIVNNSNLNCAVINILNLLINPYIVIDVDNINCSLSNNVLPCSYKKTDEYIIISIKLNNELLNSLLDPNSLILTIYGFSYSYITFNSYLSLFDYYLVYQCDQNDFRSYITANNFLTFNKNPDDDQVLLIGQGNSSLISYSFIRIKQTSPIYTQYYQLNPLIQVKSFRIKIFFNNINNDLTANYESINCFTVTGDTSLTCQYITGINPLSSNYINWDYYFIDNISINNIEDYIILPLRLTDTPPTLYISYEFDAIDNYMFCYDLYEKLSTNPDSIIIPDELKMDWDFTKILNNDTLYARQSSFFVISLNFSQDIIKPLIIEGSCFLMFFFPWNIIVNNPIIQCSFVYNSEISIFSLVLYDKMHQLGSAFFLGIKGLDILQGMDISEGIYDSIVCSDLMTPTSQSFPGSIGFIVDSGGTIIGMKTMDTEYDVFTKGIVIIINTVYIYRNIYI